MPRGHLGCPGTSWGRGSELPGLALPAPSARWSSGRALARLSTALSPVQLPQHPPSIPNFPNHPLPEDTPLCPPRHRVQRVGELRQPPACEPQRQLQLHALPRHGARRAPAARARPAAPQRGHRQHDAGVLQEGRVGTLLTSGTARAGFDRSQGQQGRMLRVALGWGAPSWWRVGPPMPGSWGCSGEPCLLPAHCRWEWGDPWGDTGAGPCQGQVSWCPQGLRDLLQGKAPRSPFLCVSPFHGTSRGPQTVEWAPKNIPGLCPAPKCPPFQRISQAVPPLA